MSLKRDTHTTQLFRQVAKKADGEHRSDGPNAITFLDELAGQIIDTDVTTGDELIDALVAWYMGELTKNTIDRFDMLDKSLEGALGNIALLVTRTRSRHQPYTVRTSLTAGRIVGQNVECNLIHGECAIPTDDILLGGNQRGAGERRKGPLVVTRIFACGYDDEHRFLSYGAPNLALQYTVDGRIKSAFRSNEYASVVDAREARKPPIQVIIGASAVCDVLQELSDVVSESEVRDFLELAKA